jgi:DNA repair exonuclease SbcCD ATPase subunit
VETKVREIMVDLLQPFNKKQTEETIKLNEVKRTLATLQKKIEDHDFLLEREGATKPTYIELQDQRIEAILAASQQGQLDADGRIKRMEAVVQVYEEKIRQLNELETRLDREILARSEESRQYKEGLDREVELMVKRQDAQTEEVNQFKNLTKAAMSKMEGRMIAFDNRLRELEDDSKHKTSDIKKLLEENSTHNEKIIKLELKAVNLNARI